MNELREAVKSRKIQYKLTKVDEIRALLGKPQKEKRQNDGGMTSLNMIYPDVVVGFGKGRETSDASFTLRFLQVRGEMIDIGGVLQGNRQIVVRSIQDFRKVELKNVDLRNLNLIDEGDYLKNQDFDSLTLWPGPEKLPAGFDPQKLLEEGKNPGLGIRALHEQGINGEGIGIAILDQPLLLGHEEYTSRLIRYDATRASWMKPRSHGSPIMGIAVGKTCGVAPKAFVFYYAMPMTAMSDNQVYCDIIDEIIKYNKAAKDSKRIRVISISTGTFSGQGNYEMWKKSLKKAQHAGILVVTCAEKGGLTLIDGKDPDKPESYKGGGSDDELLVPARNKTLAIYSGINVYGYSRGLAESWTAPYIAGLAALAFQVNPDLQPETILEQLVKTATHTKAGPVVNPRGFIESIRQAAKKQ